MTEALAQQRIASWVQCRLGSSDHMGTEIRSHGTARVDIAVFFEGQLIAIEVKLRDWRRVIMQAFLNRVFADRSYVAVPERMVTDALRAEVQRWQLGLLVLDDKAGVRIEHVAPALDPSKILRDRVWRRIAGGE